MSVLLVWLILAWADGSDSTSLAAGARKASDVSGTFVVIEGPLTGTQLTADEAGKVNKKGERHGFIRAPDAGCSHFHFEGVEGGAGEKKLTVKETDCLRVVPFYYAKDVVQNIGDALRAEEDGNLKAALKHLEHAAVDIGFEPNLKANLKKIRRAHGLDKDAIDARKAGDKKKAEALLDTAEKLKHNAIDDLPIEEKMYLPPTNAPITAVFDSANTQTVYTWGLVPRPGSAPQYRWTFTQLNDPTCNQFEANKPAANQATYHHGDTQGPCNHALEGSNGHQVVIGVTSADNYYLCVAAFSGTKSDTGPAPPVCMPQL